MSPTNEMARVPPSAAGPGSRQAGRAAQRGRRDGCKGLRRERSRRWPASASSTTGGSNAATRGCLDGVLERSRRRCLLDDAERAHLFDLARAASPNAAEDSERCRTVCGPSSCGSSTRSPAGHRSDCRRRPPRHKPARPSPVRAAVRSREQPANSARFTFLDPAAGGSIPDWDQVANDTSHIFTPRPAATRTTGGCLDLVGELSTRARSSGAVGRRTTSAFTAPAVKRLHHPIVGELELSYEVDGAPRRPGSASASTPPNPAAAPPGAGASRQLGRDARRRAATPTRWTYTARSATEAGRPRRSSTQGEPTWSIACLGRTGVPVSKLLPRRDDVRRLGQPRPRRLHPHHPPRARRRDQLRRHRRRLLARASPRRSSARRSRRHARRRRPRHQGPWPDGRRPEPAGQLAALDHPRGRELAAAAEDRLDRPLPDPPPRARAPTSRRHSARSPTSSARARSATSASSTFPASADRGGAVGRQRAGPRALPCRAAALFDTRPRDRSRRAADGASATAWASSRGARSPAAGCPAASARARRRTAPRAPALPAAATTCRCPTTSASWTPPRRSRGSPSEAGMSLIELAIAFVARPPGGHLRDHRPAHDGAAREPAPGRRLTLDRRRARPDRRDRAARHQHQPR